jgi:hypothetical protein
MFQPDDDMVTYLFHPFKDDPIKHFQDDFWPSLDTYPFEDAYLFYEKFYPLCSDFDRHQVVVSPRKS